MNIQPRRFGAALIVLASLSSVWSQTSVSFNSTSDLGTFFTRSTGADFTNTAAGGLGGSGAVHAGSLTDQAWVFNTGHALSVSQTYTASMYFQFSGDTGYGWLGFVPSTTATLPAIDPGYIRLGPNQSLGMYFDSVWSGVQNAGTILGTPASHPPLNTGDWVSATFSITYVGSNTFDLTSSISASDSSGFISGTLSSVFRSTITNSDLGSSTYLYAYFGGASPSGSFPVMDNFSTSAVPEPSSYAALIALGALVAALRLRRRSVRAS